MGFGQPNNPRANCADNGNRDETAKYQSDFSNAPRLSGVGAGWQNQMPQFC
jgi:hypothetical protein